MTAQELIEQTEYHSHLLHEARGLERNDRVGHLLEYAPKLARMLDVALHSISDRASTGRGAWAIKTIAAIEKIASEVTT